MAVTVIEMVGMVGAGKTTLASTMREHLENRGFHVLSVEEAIAVVLGRSRFGVVSRRILRSAGSRRRALSAYYKLMVRPWYTLRFIALYPGLTRIAVRAVSQSPLPIWHRRKILGLFFRPGAAQLCFVPRMRPEEALLLEEGLVHRAVNLYAWNAGAVDRTAVTRYLAALPRTDGVVLVTAPLMLCIKRAGSRGLPQRLMGRDGETIDRFMENAAQIIEGIPEFLHVDNRPSIVVDNSGELAAAVESLHRGIDQLLTAGSAVLAARARVDGDAPPAPISSRGASPATTPRFPGGLRVRRPTQRLTSTARRRPPRIPPGLVGDVLGFFDLGAADSVAGVSATSRADNVIVQTPSGTKLLKRYKASVAAAAITHEHSILGYLESRDFPSPRLAIAPDGATAHELDGRWYAVFDFHPGYFHYNEYLWPPGKHGELIGLSARALASLHTVLDDFTPRGANPNGFMSRQGDRWRDIEWYLGGLERARRYAGSGEGAAAFRRLVDADGPLLEKQLRILDAELEAATLPRQVIHGDYGPYNLLFRRGERIVILDFELARIDWRVTDIAKALQQFGMNRFGLRLGRISRFVAEYQRYRPLQSEERRVLPAVWLYLTLRRVLVCWDRFARSEDEQWLVEARRKLELADAIRQSADKLAALAGIGATRGRG